MEKLVCQMLRDGLRPYQIAMRLSVNYEVVQKICRASGIQYPGRHLDPDEIERIEHLYEIEGLPIRAIARRIGRSKTVVGVHCLRRFAAIEREGCEDGFEPQHSKTRRRCPTHGWVTTWPCVACKALGL